MAISRAWRDSGSGRVRPTMLAIAGDSAAGKTTLTRGLTRALGPERITSICVDDYHCYDRTERREPSRSLPSTRSATTSRSWSSTSSSSLSASRF